MKKFGKFAAFVTVAGAAAAGFMYFLDRSRKCQEAGCADDNEEDAKEEDTKERTYVNLNEDSEEESASDEAKSEAKDEIKEALNETVEALNEGKESLKKAVKSAAQDIIAKAEEAARGVGLVKEEGAASDFEFEDLNKACDEAEDAE